MSGATSVETPRLLLRQWRESDLEPLSAIVGDPEVARYMFGGVPLDLHGARAALEHRRLHWERDGYGFWAVQLKETGELIGWAGVQVADHFPDIMPAVEVGWMLARAQWGHGLATEAGAAGLRYGFEDLGLDRILGFYHPDNHRSEGVMRRLGLLPAGTTVDPNDGDPTMIRAISREDWRKTTGGGR